MSHAGLEPVTTTLDLQQPGTPAQVPRPLAHLIPLAKPDQILSSTLEAEGRTLECPTFCQSVLPSV